MTAAATGSPASAGATSAELADRALNGGDRGGRRDVDPAGEVFGDREPHEGGDRVGVEAAGGQLARVASESGWN